MDLRARVQQSLSGTHTIERELGGGGMSRVFVAKEQRLGRTVVVKVLAPELAAAISTERFEREIQLAASLQQANILPVLAAGDVDGLPFYTMPYVEGESLRARLAQGPVSIGRAMEILRDVARALAYAHAHGVVHRDIKPDNILLSGHTAVVADFGIAKAIAAAQEQSSGSTLTQLGTAVGTPAYMAPEQAAGDPSTDHRADIYAFGCLAYELLAGHPPFHGLSPHKLMAAHMSETPRPIEELRPDTPPALARLIARCLAKEPAQRPASAEELLRELDVTASGPGIAMPLHGRGLLLRAMALYAAAFIGVAIVARLLVDTQGLPEWVFSGALIVMALGFPVILFTGYTQYVARKVAQATPTLTPHGTLVRPSGSGTLQQLVVKASPHVSWSRTARGGVAALTVFALLVAGYLVLRVLGIGPSGSLMAAGKLNAQDRVLVATFDASSRDSALGEVVSEAVRTNLSQSRAVNVVTTNAVVGALQRMERPATARVDLALAREVAQREGIKAVVAGSVASAGEGFIITARLVNAQSGDELAVFRESAANAGEIIPTVDKLTRALRGKIGESLKSVKDAPALSQVTTSSLDALRAFAAGLRANDVEGDYPKAIALFEQAIAKDSGFAAAYVQLNYSLGNARVQPARRHRRVRGRDGGGLIHHGRVQLARAARPVHAAVRGGRPAVPPRAARRAGQRGDDEQPRRHVDQRESTRRGGLAPARDARAEDPVSHRPARVARALSPRAVRLGGAGRPRDRAWRKRYGSDRRAGLPPGARRGAWAAARIGQPQRGDASAQRGARRDACPAPRRGPKGVRRRSAARQAAAGGGRSGFRDARRAHRERDAGRPPARSHRHLRARRRAGQSALGAQAGRRGDAGHRRTPPSAGPAHRSRGTDRARRAPHRGGDPAVPSVGRRG
jgi:tRNA A-37 threonylcarbamoyl transferase component Bud32/TolB-like protein